MGRYFGRLVLGAYDRPGRLVGFDPIILLCVFNGLVADLVLYAFGGAHSTFVRLRAFAAFAVGFYFLTYFLGLLVVDGVWWPIHLWTGCIMIAGLVGWLLSYLFMLPLSMQKFGA